MTLNFKEYLEEGRDAPLYHATHLSALASIIDENRIEAIHGFDFNIKRKRKHSISQAVSLTRNIRFAERWSEYILVLDQRKLAQRYKIFPYNFFVNDEMMGGSQKTRDVSSEVDALFHGEFPHNQYEEAVLKDIKPLDKYLLKIIVNDDRWKKYPHLKNHPLIWHAKTKKFVNG